MPKPNAKLLSAITTRGVAEIISEREFVRLLNDGTPLNLKMGFDPSRPDLHLGHAVGLRKLRQLQELGHNVVLIVGDWTAQIGDPSGQSDTRIMLSADEVKQNAETYMRQFFKIIDPSQTEARYQSEWFGEFTLSEVIKLTSWFTVNQFLHRDDFATRYEQGKPIAVTEMLYPLLQAYDSVAIGSDVEFGGTDQKFNLLVGRDLQQKMGQRPQQCFMMPILPGTDGVRRMGKSLGNYIALEDTPADMFGKVMSLPDTVIPLYYELLTDVTDTELTEIRNVTNSPTENPMELKKELAVELVSTYHSTGSATNAREEFERIFQHRKGPSDIPEFSVNKTIDGVHTIHETGIIADLSRLLISCNLATSKSAAQRLLAQRAVEVDGVRTTESILEIRFGAIIRVGKRHFVRIIHDD
jgi:tyrosyl-tRNA synthetase